MGYNLLSRVGQWRASHGALLAFLLVITLPSVSWGEEYRSQEQGGIVPNEAVHAASCRVIAHVPGYRDLGSGTLIGRDDNGGFVLTCSHLFDNGAANTEVSFPDGYHSARCRLLFIDKDDLVILYVEPKPPTKPVPMADDAPTGPIKLCGYGSTGQFRMTPGRVLNYNESLGPGYYPHATVSASCESGDSGGGCFDEQNRLCGVVWGGSDNTTDSEHFASSRVATGEPLRGIIRQLGYERPSGIVSLTKYMWQPVCSNGSCSSIYSGSCASGSCSSGNCQRPYSQQPTVVYEYPSQPSLQRTVPAQVQPIQPTQSNKDLAALQASLTALDKAVDQHGKNLAALKSILEISATSKSSSCQCGDKWTTIEQRLNDIDQKLSTIKSCNCTNSTVDISSLTNQLQSIKTELDTIRQQANPQPTQPASELKLEGVVKRVPK